MVRTEASQGEGLASPPFQKGKEVLREEVHWCSLLLRGRSWRVLLPLLMAASDNFSSADDESQQFLPPKSETFFLRVRQIFDRKQRFLFSSVQCPWRHIAGGWEWRCQIHLCSREARAFLIAVTFLAFPLLWFLCSDPFCPRSLTCLSEITQDDTLL